MKFVSEEVIDQQVDALDNYTDEQYETQMEAFSNAQPVVFSWLFSEHFDLLTEDEKGFMQYLALIIFNSIVKTNGGPTEPVSEEALGAAEERNYEMLEGSNSKNFRDRLNPFFDNTPQEELLAFAEEAVLEDEDEQDAIVTKEGRELIFIALKSVIDTVAQ